LAFHEEELIIVADRALIEQVLINLISDASYAIGDRQSGEITLSARKENDATLIAVTDNGRGIPEKELSHIFVPFYSTRKDGSGIGLSLCKQIMHAHGGTIRVESEVDKGTKFILTFLNV
jgi:signal transduction histidine kinase